ncbi:MAG: EAL domain-containing protein [Oscillospiraceae bacterium]|nr:EAL domain-containing protein [Oscillospiraceae bacterium]
MARKILIVDDNQLNRQLLRGMLSADYNIREAADGAEALLILRKDPEEFSAVLLDIVMPEMDGYEMLARMRRDKPLTHLPVIVITGSADNGTEVKALALGANDFVTKPYDAEIIRHRLWNTINLRESAALANAAKWDELTGLYSRNSFFMKAGELIAAREPGYYVLACFDVDGFKVINDQYGTDKGDEVLRHIAETFRNGFEPEGGVCCRITADNFAVLYPCRFMDSERLAEIRRKAAEFGGLTMPISFSIGRYIVDDPSLSVSAMYDRAVLAKATVKGRYDVHIGQYDESMRSRLIHERQIVTEMHAALTAGQFEVWFQPQVNHISGALVGAEALVRWRHPTSGLLVPPGEFIPVFERNGFIYEMDKYIWEQVCILLRKWLDAGQSPLPVSVNISRYDMFRDDFFDVLTELVEKYNIPIELLRLEVTETAFAKTAEQIITIVKRLIDYGFTVEIDDFGSGYSSLNTLKDVPAQVLKLDMKFLENSGDTARGGNIVESVVRMAKWLNMTVIAEGVETTAQADYLKSIGCYYVQGYLYAKPMPVAEYETLASKADKEPEMMALETVAALDNNAFWDPESMETLIFNSYVGGACVVEYHNGKAEILRANDRYIQEFGDAAIDGVPVWSLGADCGMDEENLRIMNVNRENAIQTGKESVCEICIFGLDGGPGTVLYLRSTVRMIARAGDRYLFYSVMQNITAQREAEWEIRKSSEELAQMMQDMPGGYAKMRITDTGVVPLFLNDEFCRLSGMTHEQTMAMYADNAYAGVHPDDLVHVGNAIAQTVKNRSTVSLRVRLSDGNGAYVTMQVFYRVTEDADGLILNGYYTNAAAQVKAEQRQRELLDNLPCGAGMYKVKDDTISLVYQNKSYWNMVGLGEGEPFDPDPMFDVHPDDAAAFMKTLNTAIGHDRELSCDIRLYHSAQGYFPVRVSGRVVPEKSGVFLLFATFTPIAEEQKLELARREAAEQLQFLNEASHDLLVQEDVDAGIDAVLQKVLSYFDGDRAYVLEVDYISEVTNNTYEVCADGVSAEKDRLCGVPFEINRFWFDAFAHGSYINIEDVDALGDDRRDERDILKAQSISSLVAVPMYKDGKLLAAIGVDNPRRNHAHVERLRALGDYLSSMLARRDYEQRLKRGSEAHEQMLQDMPGGYAKMCITDTGLKSIFINDEYCRMSGMSHEQAMALYENDSFAGVHPDDIPTASAILSEAVANRTTVSICLRLANGNGGYTPMQAFYRVTEDKDGLYINGYYTDATEPPNADMLYEKA